MVVVAIIGVLAAVAVPNYQKFQAKARQTEAKSGLGNIQAVEGAAAVDGNTFTSCIRDIGFANTASTRYYAMGFETGVAVGTGCGPSGSGSCLLLYVSTSPTGTACSSAVGLQAQFLATTAAGKGTTAGNGQLTGTAITNLLFTATAAGSISSSSVNSYDVWSISNSGGITQVTNGL